jgi:hypothetical protein
LRRDPDPFDELLVFRRFRMNVIQFLRLRLDVGEQALCEAIKSASPSLLAGYERRAARARSIVRPPPDVPVRRVPAESEAVSG